MKIFIKGTLKISGKSFTACDVDVPDDISKEEAERLLILGVAESLENDEPELSDNSDLEENESGSDDNDNSDLKDNKSGSDDNDKLADDLTIIKGIGVKTAEELIGLGFDSFEKLANANIEDLEKMKNVSENEAIEFIEAAIELLQ